MKELKKGKRLTHIRNLVLLAKADGSISKNEENFIYTRAYSLNLTDQETEDVFSAPEEVAISYPKKLGHRILQLYDLVHLMVQDNVLYEAELQICKRVAGEMNLAESSVERVIDDVIRCMNSKMPLLMLLKNKRVILRRKREREKVTV